MRNWSSYIEVLAQFLFRYCIDGLIICVRVADREGMGSIIVTIISFKKLVPLSHFRLSVDYDPSKLSPLEKKVLSNVVQLWLMKETLNVYSIDVECVATGKRHCDRDVARIAIVNSLCEVIYSSFVKPFLPIVSYLTPLTGLTFLCFYWISNREKDLENAPSLAECKEKIRAILPSNCTLVGQGIGHGMCHNLITRRHLLDGVWKGEGLWECDRLG